MSRDAKGGASAASQEPGPPHISRGVCSDLPQDDVWNDPEQTKTCSQQPSVFALPDLSKDRVFNPVDLVNQACYSFLSSHTGFAHFARASLHGPNCSRKGPTCNVEGDARRPLWPVPPPRWRWSGSTHLGAKRRRRRRYHVAKHRLLQLVVIALNWECLGHVLWPPQTACLGFSISGAQADVLERLHDMVAHYLRAPAFYTSDLGRAAEKFQDVFCMIKELPRLGVEDLENLVQEIQRGLDPYSRHFARGKSKHADSQTAPTHSFAPTAELGCNLSGSKPVVADRVKWNYPPTFEAERFLSNELVKAAFADPEVLRLPEHMWPKAHPAKLHCSRQELLRLAARWDRLGACTVIPARSKNFDEAVGLFCVPKDADYDRLIINPKVINGRMASISDFTKSLAPGAMIALLDLQPTQVLRFSADDLSDFYYTFKVSHARCLRNAIRCKFKGWELAHLQGFPEDGDRNGEYLIALSTLAMGDSLAVEVAQQAHTHVLRDLCGAMLVHETMRYRFPCPRTDFIELLAIDDHVGIQKVTWDEYRLQTPKRDTFVFQAAERAYNKVGLVQHPKKRKRNLTDGIILGADFDGVAGRVMSPRNRVLMLSLLSLTIAARGSCTPKLLSILTGCWVHVLLFRRVLFAVMDAVFSDGSGRPQNQVFTLSRQCRNELQILGLLGPVAQADLRVSYSKKLFTTDASPSGGAVCSAQVGTHVSRELWRHSEQKGFYTRLQSPASAYLTEKGLDHVAADLTCQPVEPLSSEMFAQVPPCLNEGILFDCVEISRGTGNWSKSHEQLGLTVHDGLNCDGSRLRVSDLSNHGVARELVGLAARRVVREWHSGMPCPSFGTLRRPEVRSSAEPFGFDPKDPYTAWHNMLAHRNAFVLTVAVKMGQFVSVEQPGGSCLFRLHCYRVLVHLGCVVSHFHFCSYGSAFRKHSKWLHNKPWLIALESSCSCPEPHFIVQGNFTKSSIEQFEKRCRPSASAVFGRPPRPGEKVSSYSGAYPIGLTDRMASGSVAAKRGARGVIPSFVHSRTLSELQMPAISTLTLVGPEPVFDTRQWWDDPEWVNELCECLDFREMFRYKFTRSGHININEARTYKSWIKAMAKSEPDSRFLGLLDSRVTIGATAKGRSSSFALSRVLQGCVCYIIGSGLYPGCLHCGSKHNRADEPSRDKAVRPPSREPPRWLTDLQAGNPASFDCVHASSRFEKNPARWLRFLLLLAGDIEENPGPVRPQVARGPMDLSVGFAESTAQRMHKCLLAFKLWVENEFPNSWSKLERDCSALCWAVRAYGLHCFSSGLPRYMFVYTITAIQDQYPGSKNHMSVAWQIDKKWQAYEPGQCRAVLPASAVRAAVCLACLWQWLPWAGVVLLAFSAMLHPSELVALVRKDFVFPRDLDFEMSCLFLHIQNPKTARFARRQHGRIDDEFVIWFCEKLFFDLPLDQKLFPGSIHQFRRLWNCIMKRLGIPFKQTGRGATPGVLRGSGATYLYALSEDIAWIAWRGRWARTKTLEFYLQEVAAQLLLHQLDPVARETIRVFDSASYAVLCASVAYGVECEKRKTEECLPKSL